MNERGNNTSVVILTLLVLLLMLGLSILIYKNISQKRSMTSMIEQMEFEKEQLEKDFSDLEVQFEEFDGVKIENDSLVAQITKEQQHVQNLLEELRTTKATNARKIAELKKELASVRGLLKEYVRQIDLLTEENTQLTEENKAVKKQFKDVSEYADRLGKRNTELTGIVNRASMLEIDELHVTKLNKKNRKTSLASQVVKLQFDYTIRKNVTTSPGLKTLYVQISNVAGDIFHTDESGTFEYEGSTFDYTISKEFEYSNEELSDVIYWSLEERLPIDTYTVDFFVDGEMVGSFEFDIVK